MGRSDEASRSKSAPYLLGGVRIFSRAECGTVRQHRPGRGQDARDG